MPIIRDGYELCNLYDYREIRTRFYHEDEICIIVDCEICAVPMAVLKRHTPTPTVEEREHIHAQLRALGDGRLDDIMRNIPDHYHAHLRPTPYWLRDDIAKGDVT